MDVPATRLLDTAPAKPQRATDTGKGAGLREQFLTFFMPGFNAARTMAQFHAPPEQANHRDPAKATAETNSPPRADDRDDPNAVATDSHGSDDSEPTSGATVTRLDLNEDGTDAGAVAAALAGQAGQPRPSSQSGQPTPPASASAPELPFTAQAATATQTQAGTRAAAQAAAQAETGKPGAVPLLGEAVDPNQQLGTVQIRREPIKVAGRANPSSGGNILQVHQQAAANQVAQASAQGATSTANGGTTTNALTAQPGAHAGGEGSGNPGGQGSQGSGSSGSGANPASGNPAAGTDLGKANADPFAAPPQSFRQSLSGQPVRPSAAAAPPRAGEVQPQRGGNGPLAPNAGGQSGFTLAATSHSQVRASARPHPAANSKPAAAQISVTLAKAVRNGDSTIRMQLRPAELGKVEVKLEIAADNAIKATIVAEKAETMELLQRDARVLEKVLQEAGLKTDQDSLNFQLKDGGNGDADRSGSQQAGRGDDADGRSGDADDGEDVAQSETQTGAGIGEDGSLNLVT